MVFLFQYQKTAAGQQKVSEDIGQQLLFAINEIAKENIVISLSKYDAKYAAEYLSGKDRQLLVAYARTTEGREKITDAEFDKLPVGEQQKIREGLRELLLYLGTDPKYVTDLKKSGSDVSANFMFVLGFFSAMHLDPPKDCFDGEGELKLDKTHQWLDANLPIDAELKDGALARMQLEKDVEKAAKEELKSIVEKNMDVLKGTKGTKKSSSLGQIPPTSPLFIYWPYLADRVSTVDLQGLYATPDVRLSVAVPNYLKLGPVIRDLRAFGSIIDASKLGDYKNTLKRLGSEWLDTQISGTSVLQYLRTRHNFIDDSEATANSFRALLTEGNYPDAFRLIKPGSSLYNAFQVEAQLPLLSTITTKISQESMAAAIKNAFSAEGSVQFVLGRDHDLQVYFDYTTASFEIGSTTGKEEKFSAGARWLATIRSLGDLNLMTGSGVTYSKVKLLDLYSGNEFKPFVEIGAGKTIGGDKFFVLADAYYKHIFAKKSPSEDFFTVGVSPTLKTGKFQISAGPRMLYYKNTELGKGQVEFMGAGSLSYEILNDNLTLYGSFTKGKTSNFQVGVQLKLGN